MKKIFGIVAAAVVFAAPAFADKVTVDIELNKPGWHIGTGRQVGKVKEGNAHPTELAATCKRLAVETDPKKCEHIAGRGLRCPLKCLDKGK